ncbi:DUF2948 family protein [Aureimonas sp. ME7]|uniref:DUF2948 family protein n=1 Tax=Aureimonas sp. ME7 TaxID=2744252 RepID=UPI0015F3ADB2|nr:DUF2948 family protein [Aureimonas sp. ME7]
MDQLRLNALDAEDLAVLSAHTQDAVARAGDLTLDTRARRFLVPVNRFVWEKTPPRRWFGGTAEHERRRSVLRFDRVLAARRVGIDPASPDEILSLLALRWIEGEAPSGTIELVFAGEAAIRLDIECIEVQLTDLGPAWTTASQPNHRV